MKQFTSQQVIKATGLTYGSLKELTKQTRKGGPLVTPAWTDGYRILYSQDNINGINAYRTSLNNHRTTLANLRAKAKKSTTKKTTTNKGTGRGC